MGTARQYHKKCIQGVLQTKVHQGSVTIKSTARECHQGVSNQKYCQGPQQSNVLPGTATIKSTARECLNEIHPGSATNRSKTKECHNQNDH